MPTMAEAIEETLRELGGRASREEIRKRVEEKYPETWQPSTLTAHLYGCVVNNPKSYIHHSSTRKFLFRCGDGLFEFYDPAKHGENVWVPTEEDGAAVIDEALEASISMERDLEEFLAQDLDRLESGLTLIDRQFRTEVGIIDILAKDRENRLVAIELKVGEAKDSAVRQVAGYLGSLTRSNAGRQAARAMLVASAFSDRARMAASVIAGLSLLVYKVNFHFTHIQ